MTLIPDESTCCVEGCDMPAVHVRSFTISAEAWGETTVHPGFCCDHLDQFQSEEEPFVDLRLAGRIREARS